MIRVVVVDDDQMVCAHLRTILGLAEDIDVVDEAYDGAEALDSVTRHRPDVVLMDLRMPSVDGITATKHITAIPEPPVVVVLTTFDADHHILRALQAGASGYLLKSTRPVELIGLVRVASEGHGVFSSVATRRILRSVAEQQSVADEKLATVGELTDREAEVLACLGSGLSNGEIALRLHLTESTIKGHVSRILLQLNCRNRTQAGLIAQHLGLTAAPRTER